MLIGINRTLAAVAAVLFGVGMLWTLGEVTVSSIRRHAAAERDVVWDKKLKALEVQHAKERKALQSSIDQAASVERAAVAIEQVAARSRVLSLEAEIGRLTSDPVIPRTLVRELRK